MSRTAMLTLLLGAFSCSATHAQTTRAPDAQAVAQQAAAAEAAAAPELSTRNDDLQEVIRADGTSVIDLKGRYQMQTSLVRMPDGSMKMVCQDEAAGIPHVHADGSAHQAAAEDNSR